MQIKVVGENQTPLRETKGSRYLRYPSREDRFRSLDDRSGLLEFSELLTGYSPGSTQQVWVFARE